jgi:RNA recognition motif-containing protein
MNKKLYVGNLPYSVTPETLQELFAAVGSVVSADVISDRMTGRSKGFGFVEMGTEEEAQKAIDTLNGRDVDGRTIKVAEAHPPRRDRGGGGFGGGRRSRYDDW